MPVDAPVYNILNDIYKLMLFTQDSPDEIKVNTIKISMDYKDINFGRKVSIPLVKLPSRTVFIEAFMNVTEEFEISGGEVPVFGVGVPTSIESESNVYGLFKPSNTLLASTGIKSADGSLFDEEILNSRIANLQETDLVATFEYGPVWAAEGSSGVNRSYFGMTGKVSSATSMDVLVAGGWSGSAGISSSQKYNGTSWTLSGTVLGANFVGSRCTGTTSEAFLFGGANGFFTGYARQYSALFDGSSWSHGAELLVWVYGPGVSDESSSGYISVIGGRLYSTIEPIVNRVQNYNTTGNSFTTGDPLIGQRSNMGCSGPADVTWVGGGIGMDLKPIPWTESRSESLSSTWRISGPPNVISNWASAAGSQLSAIYMSHTSVEEWNGVSFGMLKPHPSGGKKGIEVTGNSENALATGGMTLAESSTGGGDTYLLSRTISGATSRTLENLVQGSLEIYLTYTYN